MPAFNFIYGKYSFEIYRIAENRKTVRLTIYPNLKIVLFTPLDFSDEKIDSFLKRKINWINKQLKELKRLKRNGSNKQYISGESLLYLGRQYKLIVEKADIDSVSFKHGRIIVNTTKSVTDSQTNQILLDHWYLKQSERVLKERYNLMLKKFAYTFTPELSIRKMSKRWGSFLAKRKILLNPELIKAHKECIDYVIIHELCHMKHNNHSAAYYRFLTLKCPNWRSLKEQLELRFAGY